VWLRFLYRAVAGLPHRLRGTRLVNRWREPPGGRSPGIPDETRESSNPVRDYFDRHDEGPGLQKWLHYFEIYHRHLGKFVGRNPVVVEVGVGSGGSLAMWRQYFGAGSRVHGIDIDPGCIAYREPDIDIHIGDQADRAMWERFRKAVPDVDILIDDGGHTVLQQRVTVEEMLPHLRPGGVYISEDVHGIGNRFTEFACALGRGLNAYSFPDDPSVEPITRTPFQAAIDSLHLYPFLVVIEKHASAQPPFLAPGRGTQWRD
jgi:SAM-dependent methyltransferase